MWAIARSDHWRSRLQAQVRTHLADRHLEVRAQSEPGGDLERVSRLIGAEHSLHSLHSLRGILAQWVADEHGSG
jgi:hypothetical protein